MSDSSIVPRLPASRPDLPPEDGQHSLLRKAKRFWAEHGDNPVKFTAKYLTEFFQFGSCVIDKQGLSDRYLALGKWSDPAKTTDGGDWIHFFTITAPKSEDGSSNADTSAYSSSCAFHPPRHGASQPAPATIGGIGVEINPYGTDQYGAPEQTATTESASEFDRFMEAARKDKAKWDAKIAAKAAARLSAAGQSHPYIGALTNSILGAAGRSRSTLSVDAMSPNSETSSLSSVDSDLSGYEHSSPPQGASGSPQGEKKHHRHHHSPQHFIVLPWIMGYRWQGIPIGGVEDEVEAHTGIFFPKKNFEYDGVVERTANFAIEVVK
jgi:hypothetical protein